LAAADSQAAAQSIAGFCGDSGYNALGAAMRRRRFENSSGIGSWFHPTIADTALVSAAEDIAQDATASSEVRTLSLGILYAFATNLPIPFYENYVEMGNDGMCATSVAPSTSHPFEVRTLPPALLEIVQPIALAIERDSTQSKPLRTAANCITNAARLAAALPMEPIISTSSPLQLEYVCGRTFRIKNLSGSYLNAQYSVDGAPTRATIGVAGGRSAQPYGEVRFNTPASGAVVNLYFDGGLVATVAATGTGCW
jgi:hypothetical protein